jgi:hypothetical protein
MADAHKNFAYSTVATAPSPGTSGTSLDVASGHGTRFPAVPFNATVWPAGERPTPGNAEIVRVTTISTDTFTITRTQESTSARDVVIGDQIAATVTAKTLTDAETNWTKVFDYSGASFADFTIDNGSWASDGSTINVAASTTLVRCRVTSRQPVGFGCVFEAEVRGGSLTGTNIKMGVLFGWDGAGTGANTCYLYSADTSPESGGEFRQENDAVTASINIAQNWNASQYYKIRVVWSGYVNTGYLDGVQIATAGSIPQRDSSFVGLICQGGTFNFKNIKLWTPNLELPA